MPFLPIKEIVLNAYSRNYAHLLLRWVAEPG